MLGAMRVRGAAAAASPAAVQAYRRYGALLVEDFLSPATAAELAAAALTVATVRGPRVFPGADDDTLGKVHLTAEVTTDPARSTGPQGNMQSMSAAHSSPQTPEAAGKSRGRAGRRRKKAKGGEPWVATPSIDGGDAPPLSAAEAAELRRLQTLERQRPREVSFSTARLDMRLRNQRQVDRAWRRLRRVRDRYNRHKFIDVEGATAEEEASGARLHEDPERMRQLAQQVSYDKAAESFEKYRASGRLEQELARDLHLAAALAHLKNAGRSWAEAWREPAGAAAVLRPEVGGALGAAAAALAGEVVVRLYSDSVAEFFPFMNMTPFSFSAAMLNFKHPGATAALVGLPGGDPSLQPEVVLLPGSHRAVRAATRDGTQLERFPGGHVFDHGYLARVLPEVAALPPATLRLRPGAALFVNTYTMFALCPSLAGGGGVLGPYAAPEERPLVAPHLYSATLMPDRCVFDGQRTTWSSRDTHGPLYAYEKGQLLTDDDKFPVLHTALDVE